MHNFNPYPNTLDLGPLSLSFYALAIVTGILVALYLGYAQVRKLGLNENDLSDGFFWGLILGVIGTRVYYVIFEWARYADDPISAFYIWEGGLAIHGAIIFVAVFLFFFTRKRKLNIFQYLEVLVPGFLLAQAFGRWGNFFNQEAHGGVVPGLTLDARRAFLSETLFIPDFITNNMYLMGPSGLDYYHPTFLYESLWNLAGFLLMFFVLRKIKGYFTGDVLSFYLIWYSIGRFFIEGLRTDSLYLGDIRVAQLISVLLIITGVALFVVRRVREIYPVSYQSIVEGVQE
jgi:phosphatidylglycerol:prolipoprotein diacylglycerol transferase